MKKQELYESLKTNGRWWLDNGHQYLQQYCVLEVCMMVFLCYAFSEQMTFIYLNHVDMPEWKLAAFASFPAATWLMIKDVWQSVNSNYRPPVSPSAKVEDSAEEVVDK